MKPAETALMAEKPFEAPPDCPQGAAHAGTVQDDDSGRYFGLHPFQPLNELQGGQHQQCAPTFLFKKVMSFVFFLV